MLALAVGAKVWPVLLLPALLRQRGAGWKRIGMAAGGFAASSVMIVSPLLLAGFGDTAGLRAYAGHWQMNASLYQGFHLLAGWIAPDDADRAAQEKLLAAFVAPQGLHGRIVDQLDRAGSGSTLNTYGTRLLTASRPTIS